MDPPVEQIKTSNVKLSLEGWEWTRKQETKNENILSCFKVWERNQKKVGVAGAVEDNGVEKFSVG